MTKKFYTLRAQMTPASQARANEKAHAMLAEMPLNELRTVKKTKLISDRSLK